MGRNRSQSRNAPIRSQLFPSVSTADSPLYAVVGKGFDNSGGILSWHTSDIAAIKNMNVHNQNGGNCRVDPASLHLNNG